MTSIYWILTFSIIIYNLISKQALNPNSIALLLICIIPNLLRSKFFFKGKALLFIISLLFTVISIYNPIFIPILGIVLYYLVFDRLYYLALIMLLITLVIISVFDSSSTIFWIINGMLLGCIFEYYQSKESHYLKAIDEERRLRHENETVKNQLLAVQGEIELLSEIRERNRIAKQIHDNVGHNLAGVIFHLQAANKLFYRDNNASKMMIEESIDKLSKTLDVTRETVHNLESDLTIGIYQIKKIINDYNYCPVIFVHNGNFNDLKPTTMNILIHMLKESLTNATKYSSATEVKIELSVNDSYVRYFYHDNGVGCENIKMNLGLRSMNERIDNIGGTFVIDGKNGFRITANLPK